MLLSIIDSFTTTTTPPHPTPLPKKKQIWSVKTKLSICNHYVYNFNFQNKAVSIHTTTTYTTLQLNQHPLMKFWIRLRAISNLRRNSNNKNVKLPDKQMVETASRRTGQPLIYRIIQISKSTNYLEKFKLRGFQIAGRSIFGFFFSFSLFLVLFTRFFFWFCSN